ncbi:PhzF family phenazine biosynthesis protein [Brevibacillus fluminis]|uniref:PhzF family phenazine biosynthesis protein n=1 Tax=Brevibacillus fluminis TaxID=511487 RepID=UPI003F8C6F13
MKEIDIYLVDAFTSQSFGGNAAGVVPHAEGLSDEQMQRIARELNQSETAFLFPSERSDADFRVRFFTPTVEIDFCGHATVGSAWLLATRLGWADRAEKVVFDTNIGLVPIAWEKENGALARVTMTQAAPKVKPLEYPLPELARLLGIRPDDLDERYPLRIASTANWHLLVPVKTQAAIDAAAPLLAELGKMNEEIGVVTTHLFTFAADRPGYDLYTRDFCPAIGIPEDPVTGSANGALSGYLALEGLVPADAPARLVIGQGDAVGRPGTLHAMIEPAAPSPIIKISGAAVITVAGRLAY